MVAKEVSFNGKAKNTFKYEYFPGFLLCPKNAGMHQNRLNNS